MPSCEADILPRAPGNPWEAVFGCEEGFLSFLSVFLFFLRGIEKTSP